MSDYSDFVESRKAQKDSEYQAFVKSRLAQKQKTPSNAAVAGSSLVKGVAAIPDMFINAAPNLVGLGMAGTGFAADQAANLVGRDNTLGRYFSKVNELANSGLENFDYAPSITNKTLRAVAPIADPETEGQRVMDWGLQTATGTLFNPSAGALGMAKNALKFGAAGTVGGVVAEKTGSPWAGIAASIAAPIAASAVGARLNRIPQSVTPTGRENVAGRQILNSVSDPQKAITALENAPRPTVARSKATSGQVIAQQTGDTGLLKSEDVMRQRIGVADEINQRYAANAEARRLQLLRMMRDPDSAPTAVKLARDEIERLGQQQATTSQQAIREQQTSLSNLGTTTSADSAAQRLLAVSDPIVAAKKLDISNKFDVDPFGEVTALRIPAAKIDAMIADTYGGLSVAQTSKVREALKLINQAAAQNKAAVDIPELNAIRPQVPKLPTFNRDVVNPQLDDMLTAVAKYGGISRDEAARLGIDPKVLNTRGMGGLVPFPKTGGMGSDDMMTRLQQDGYPVDLLDDALQGYKVYAPQGHELRAARADAERNLELFNEELKLNPDMLGSTMSYKQMRTIEERIGEMQRAAFKDPNSTGKDRAVLTQLKHLIRGSMDDGVKNGNVPKDIYDNYKAAMKSHAEFKQQHDQGAAAGLLPKGFDRNSQNLASIPTKMLSTREGLESFKKAMGSEPEARQALSDHLATTFRNEVLIPSTGGTKSGWQDKAAKWFDANKLALEEFTDLRAKIADSIQKSKTVDGLALRFEQDTKNMLKSGGSTFNNLKDPSAVIDSFIASKSRLNDSQFIVKMANDSPQFKTALRGAVAEKVSGMTDLKAIAFIENKANRELIKGLFGETALRKFDRVLVDAKRDRIGTTLGGVSGAATFGRGATDKLMNQSIWKLDAGGSTIGAALGTLLGGGVMGTAGGALGGALTAHGVKTMNMKQNATTAKAMLDPKYGAELLKKQLAPTPYKRNSLELLMKYSVPATIPAQPQDKK